jgi:hypothetical protein
VRLYSRRYGERRSSASSDCGARRSAGGKLFVGPRKHGKRQTYVLPGARILLAAVNRCNED